MINVLTHIIIIIIYINLKLEIYMLKENKYLGVFLDWYINKIIYNYTTVYYMIYYTFTRKCKVDFLTHRPFLLYNIYFKFFDINSNEKLTSKS